MLFVDVAVHLVAINKNKASNKTNSKKPNNISSEPFLPALLLLLLSIAVAVMARSRVRTRFDNA